MAVVHRATKRGVAGFERVVALKRLLPHLAQDDQFVRGFIREAKLASRLNHPNIARIYELGQVDSTYFISMEYVGGYQVLELLQHAAREHIYIPIPVVLCILQQLCDALDHAHTRTDRETGQPLGIVHRDITPSNLILTPFGHLKVIDFGIANANIEDLHTCSGQVKGKFGYMAPEILDGVAPNAGCDLFSVGVLAHELLTSRRLFGSHNDFLTLDNVKHADIHPPSWTNPACPAELDDLVMAALERNPACRLEAASIMRTVLQQVAVAYQLDATPARLSCWLDDTYGEAVELIVEADPDSDSVESFPTGWVPGSLEESLSDLDEHTLVDEMASAFADRERYEEEELRFEPPLNPAPPDPAFSFFATTDHSVQTPSAP